ncbi:helix-turn-helix transcriptional regulator [Morganella morganii]|uniref:helix-turn-helix transcriptional regulator n=1 Tax=Morganella morganii TaxID=582 RepID=UPI0009071654|nr:AlpA family phage regulatory protein [Morganella morganii]ELN8405485.1 AlpA family phage regulatory protein [Morganella morganii]MDS0905916.1 AlpA family phage regulatory protein [Morganella morganii]RTY16794.1 AlpA family phage regulatory protein [Morganella morganii subsp. morganii]HCT3282657.1 AlpA family phage regulatory protein [Morganella morganii]HCU1238777.1 AlpA family phage regulatory protein [Morganella morganii]
MDPNDRLINFKMVAYLTGLSRSTIWKLENNGDFPERVTLSKRSIRWIESEVMQWVSVRMRMPIKQDDTIHKVRAKKAAKHEQRAL